jgi:hypothetical protein
MESQHPWCSSRTLGSHQRTMQPAGNLYLIYGELARDVKHGSFASSISLSGGLDFCNRDEQGRLEYADGVLFFVSLFRQSNRRGSLQTGNPLYNMVFNRVRLLIIWFSYSEHTAVITLNPRGPLDIA